MGDWHKDNLGGKLESDHNLESIVKNIIDEEIFPAPKNRRDKVKQGLEKFVFSHSSSFAQVTSAALGVAVGVYSYFASSALSDVILSANPQPYSGIFPIFMSGLIGVTARGLSKSLLDSKIKKYAGAKICGINEEDEEQKKENREKKNFLQKYHLPLSLTTGVAAAGFFAQQFYHHIISGSPAGHEIASQNPEKILFGISPLTFGFLGLWTTLFNYLGKLQKMLNSKGMSAVAYAPVKYPFSKEKQMRHIKEEAEKGNIYALERLAMLNKDFEEKLDFQRRITEKIKDGNIAYGGQINWLKLRALAGNYFALQKKKHNPANIMTYMALLMYPSNPGRAVKFLNRLSKTKELDIESEVLYFRNVLLNAHEADTPENWNEFIEVAQREGKLETKKGSEGKVAYFFDKTFLKKNFISKYSLEDKTEKFLAEKAIHKILQGTEILFENPLFIYNKGNEQIQIFLREGEKDLREVLEAASVPEKRVAFEKAVQLLLNYQEKVFSAIQKKDGEFILNSEYRGNKQGIVIPVLDLEKNLMMRAFIGLRKEGKKLGENEYLPALMDKLMEQNQDYNKQSLTFNHGDALAQNITETLCIIDPWPIIAHSYYDITNLAADPVFLALDFNPEKKLFLKQT